MNRIHRLMSASALTLSTAVAAQTPPASVAPGDQADIVVTGIRRSIQQSIDTKRTAIGVIDAISAEDIGKLPDQNIADSMKRISGVQVTQRDGEGNGFAIRGLDLNRVQINGRAYTGPNQNATPQLQTLNPEILAGIEVAKTPTADQIEGSLGGTVNLKTRRPLDTNKDFIASGRMQGLYSDQIGKWGYRGSGLISKQFADRTFGLLGAISYGRDKGVAEGYSTGGWKETTATSNQYQPNRLVEQIEERDDRRLTANGAMQWKPDDKTDFVVEATYSRFKVNRDLDYFQTLLTPTAALGQTATFSNPTVLADGTIAKATVSSVTVRPLVYSALTDYKSLNLGSTLKRKFGNLTVVLDGSYSSGKGQDGQTGAPFTFVVVNSPANKANVTYDLTSSKINPNFALTGNYDINNPQNYQLSSLFDGNNLSDNKGYDGKIDFQYDFDGGWLRGLKAGARWEKIHLFANNPQSTPAVNAAMLAIADKNRDGGIRPDELSGLTYTGSYDGFLSNLAGDFPRNFPTGTVDAEAGRAAIGVGGPAAAPASVRDVTQTTWAGYFMANFQADVLEKTVRLNAGARFVSTDRLSKGNSVNGTLVTPVSSMSHFNHFLPSANVSIDLTRKLIFRMSAAKVIARPNLQDVGPGITLNPVNFSASVGNPALKPFEATQEDATLEWYLAPASLLSIAVFNKSINSFVTPTTTAQTVPGYGSTIFQVSQPQNGTGGKVRGFEVGYQHAFRFLPAPFNGLGIQANLTYAKSTTPLTDLDPNKTLPLANLSKISYNAVLYYENKRWSARVAWNYRSKFLTTVQSQLLAGSIWTAGFGQLDASATFNINDRLRLTFDGSALNKPATRQYTGTVNRTSLTYYNDRRFAFGIAATF